jgi:RNase adapter protein RapZ
VEVLVVTGLSGAGKSTALAALEDLGFYCADNVPVPLLPDLLRILHETDAMRRVAVGVDARESALLRHFPGAQAELTAAGHRVEILFLEAPDDVLVRRYSETRRMHPMGELPQAIQLERAVLSAFKGRTTATIDTGNLRARELRQMIRDRYGTRGVLHLVLMSFGFKAGLPAVADLVFDTRFLANPYDVHDLRPLGGLDARVADYVLGQPDAQTLLDHVTGLLRFVVPRSVREGRSYLTVALGCTGGQHRSVALTEALANRLQQGEPLSRPSPQIVVRHRDLAGPAARTSGPEAAAGASPEGGRG